MGKSYLVQKLQSKFFRQSITSFGYNFISIVCALISITILTEYLGKEIYGFWITIFAICNWINFLDGGFGNSLRNELSISLLNKNKVKSKKLVSTAYVSLTLFMFVLFLILIFCHLFFDWAEILNDKKLNYNALALFVFGFFLVQMILKLLGKVFFSTGKGQNNFLMGALINGSILICLWFISFFNYPNGLWNVAIIYSIVPVVVVFILSVIFYVKQHSELRPSLKDFEKKYVNVILVRGGNFFLIQMSSGLLQAVTPFFITLWVSSSISAEYYISIRYYGLILVILNIILQMMWGNITLDFNKDPSKSIRIYLKRSFLVGVGLIVILIIMYLLSQYVFKLWIGGEFVISNSINLICLLSIMSVVFSKCFTNILNAIGLITKQSFISIAIIALYVPSIYIAVRVFGLGITGIILTPSLFFLIQGIIAYVELKSELQKKTRTV